jgi:hypothetical protein
MPKTLAARRSIKRAGVEIERTPLLVPSFSSKGFPDVDKIMATTAEFLAGPALVSAYDLHYQHVQPPFNFASTLFLDSGGYEAAKDFQFSDLSDTHERSHVPELWTSEFHMQVLQNWVSEVPTIFISYDHPRQRLSLPQQLERARRMFAGEANVLRELLLKPTTEHSKYLNVDDIVPHIHSLAEFSVIGVTEKEIGNSIFDRMKNIARIRKALTAAGLQTPIHVFGSLDTVTTPLYFLAGADIFDGLTWLRFAFHGGQTIYRQSFGALHLNAKTNSAMVDPMCWTKNVGELQDMELDMRRFLADHDFAAFRYHGDNLKRIYESIIEEVE